MFLLNQEGNMLLPVECLVFEINKANPVEIIAYPVEAMCEGKSSGVIVGKYETEKRTKEVFTRFCSLIGEQSMKFLQMLEK